MSINASEASARRARFRSGMSAADAHDCMKQSLIELRRAEKNAVLCFAEIMRRKLYRELGYSSIHLYAREALGFSKVRTSQFIRLAGSLEKLPALKASVASGKIPWTKAREVARVATPRSEARWIAKAAESSSRELEAEVKRVRIREASALKHDQRQASLLEMEPEPAPEIQQRRKITLDLTLEEQARFEALVEKIRKRSRAAGLRQARRETIILEALGALLDPETQEGSRPEFPRGNSASPYQVVVYRCEQCGGRKTTSGAELSKASSERIACDARVLEPNRKNRSTIPPATRRAVLARDRHRCQGRGCGNTRFLEVHHLTPRSKGGGNKAENLVTLCSACHQLLHEREAHGMSVILKMPTARA